MPSHTVSNWTFSSCDILHPTCRASLDNYRGHTGACIVVRGVIWCDLWPNKWHFDIQSFHSCYFQETAGGVLRHFPTPKTTRDPSRIFSLGKSTGSPSMIELSIQQRIDPSLLSHKRPCNSCISPKNNPRKIEHHKLSTWNRLDSVAVLALDSSKRENSTSEPQS